MTKRAFELTVTAILKIKLQNLIFKLRYKQNFVCPALNDSEGIVLVYFMNARIIYEQDIESQWLLGVNRGDSYVSVAVF